MLNGANSRVLTRITGKTIREEATRGSRSFDLVRWIRCRRVQWLGHILRMNEDRMLFKGVSVGVYLHIYILYDHGV